MSVYRSLRVDTEGIDLGRGIFSPSRNLGHTPVYKPSPAYCSPLPFEIAAILQSFSPRRRLRAPKEGPRIKGTWSPEEDRKLRELVAQFGPRKWSRIAAHLPGRIGKQCRERWFNHLDDSVDHSQFTREEDLILAKAHRTLGNQWAAISATLAKAGFPGRTSNAVKNHWNSAIRKACDRLDEMKIPMDEWKPEHFVYKCRKRRRTTIPSDSCDDGSSSSQDDGMDDVAPSKKHRRTMSDETDISSFDEIQDSGLVVYYGDDTVVRGDVAMDPEDMELWREMMVRKYGDVEDDHGSEGDHHGSPRTETDEHSSFDEDPFITEEFSTPPSSFVSFPPELEAELDEDGDEPFLLTPSLL
eukprot:TRINITY_DN1429_c0_g1_i2.p1 TRINITY_DN1429_c0_g1~~TRINITY_DN1429_c0_g1_i2.p1  ORF type:complete len:379 (-),score=127.61 TRINITY_DN1429_c0_g1_i2:196-1263(-)